LSDTFSEPDPEIDEVWGREIDRRLAELESGQVQGIPAEEVMAKASTMMGL
jgi:putative addiction module component (TIGR02574 family)